MLTKNDSKGCLRNFREYLMEYCANTSIHGFKFLGEKGRSIIERIWWLAVLVVSLFFCVSLILEAYHKWEQSPVVVSFATSETPIFKIPFPAVTICPEIKSRKSLVNFTKLVLKRRSEQLLTDLEMRDFERISTICSERYRLKEEENPSKIIDIKNMADFLLKVQPDFYNTVHECYWQGQNFSDNIREIFTPLLTKEGICYTFNLVDRDEIFTAAADTGYYGRLSTPHQPPSEWSLDKGYNSTADLDSYPRRTAVGGIHGGLDLILFINSTDLDYLCADGLQGYKVILHNPSQIPYVEQRYFRVGLNQDTVVMVKPNIITTSKQLRNYKALQRKCFFPEEKKLKYFQIYDQQNCLHECVANYTYNHCGCVGFFMLRDDSIPVCGPGNQGCMEEAAGIFLTEEIKVRIKYNQSKSSKYHPKPENCNCFPTCNSLTFEAEVSQSKWHWKERTKLLGDEDEFSISDRLSRLQIFFKDMQFITSERNELYGRMDFLASCGGLLGLFIGFSFVSIVEIVYYVSLRLFCNIKRHSCKNWSGSELSNEKVHI